MWDGFSTVCIFVGNERSNSSSSSVTELMIRLQIAAFDVPQQCCVAAENWSMAIGDLSMNAPMTWLYVAVGVWQPALSLIIIIIQRSYSNSKEIYSHLLYKRKQLRHCPRDVITWCIWFIIQIWRHVVCRQYSLEFYRTSYVLYQTLLLSVTLSDVEGHFGYFKDF